MPIAVADLIIVKKTQKTKKNKKKQSVPRTKGKLLAEAAGNYKRGSIN